MMPEPRLLDRELEVLGRLVAPDRGRILAAVMAGGRSRSRFDLPRLARLPRIAPVVAVMAALMLVIGPLAVRLMVVSSGNPAATARQILQPFQRVPPPDASEHRSQDNRNEAAPSGDQAPAVPSGAAAAGAPGQPATAPAGTSAPAAGAGPANPPSTAVAACAPADMAVTATTDRLTYSVGQHVVITLTAANRGAVACQVDRGQCQVIFDIHDSSGQTLFTTSPQLNFSCSASNVSTVAPGRSVAATYDWDQMSCFEIITCTSKQATPVGSYSAGGSWAFGGASTAAVNSNRSPFRIE